VAEQKAVCPECGVPIKNVYYYFKNESETFGIRLEVISKEEFYDMDIRLLQVFLKYVDIKILNEIKRKRVETLYDRVFFKVV